MWVIIAFLLGFLLCTCNALPSLRQQAIIQNSWRQERIQTHVLNLMLQYEVDLWLILHQEYAADTVWPVIKTATTFQPRRRTATVFYIDSSQRIQEVQYISYDKSLFQNLRNLLQQVQPNTIALGVDDVFAFSDGLHSGMRDLINSELGDLIQNKIVHHPLLMVYAIDIRASGQLEYYREIMQIAHNIISEGFSNSIITPGITTTDDVVWWFREKIQAMNFTTWFQPTVDIQRKDSSDNSNIIKRGDMLHCDFGIVFMEMCTDTQHLGYVLLPGESAPPPDLIRGLEVGNALQKIVIENLVPGQTGNQILLKSLEQMKSQGINGTVYSHPIGDYGHSAGPTIGLWDVQEPIPKRGDVALLPNTWFSVELQATSFVPSWNKNVVFALEEDAYVDSLGKSNWVFKNQQEFHLIQ